MTNNQLAENSVIQLLNSVKLARDNAERADNRGDHSFYYALTIALEELQERRKAEKDSEPVAWTWHYREQWHVTNDERRAEFVAKDGDVAVLPLYRHAQPSIVPDAIPVSRDIDAGYLSGWNDCRAAMLATAPQSPGSEPATVPGKWIPVSERVPTKQDGSVFLTWNGQYIGKELFLMGSFQCLKPEIITHWMPLPTAPQEVK